MIYTEQHRELMDSIRRFVRSIQRQLNVFRT